MGSPAYDRFWGTALAIVRSGHHAVDRLSRGRIGARFPGGAQVGWIHTLGRRSGQWRRTALLIAPDGRHWVVAGSNVGREQVPAWVHNIRAHPHGRLEIRGTSVDVTFEELSGEDRDRSYALLVRDWGPFRMYERHARRTIPVFRLTPDVGAAGGAPTVEE